MPSTQTVGVAPADGYAEVQRPLVVTPTDVARCMEVEREPLRVAAAEDMALARDAAERGSYAKAVRILDAAGSLLPGQRRHCPATRRAGRWRSSCTS